MTVAHILSDKGHTVVTVAPDHSIAAAVATLNRHRIGAVVVLDGSGAVCGVLSERDIVRALAEYGADALADPVNRHMTERVVVCEPEDPIDDVMEAMTHGRFRHVPVVAGDHLVGIVSIGDVVKRKIAQAEYEVGAMREYIATG